MIPFISFLLFYNHPTAYYFAQLKQGGLDSVNLFRHVKKPSNLPFNFF